MARNQSLKVRFTDEEYNRLMAEAKRKGIAAGEIMRDLLKRHFDEQDKEPQAS